jgi:hypothetical protein
LLLKINHYFCPKHYFLQLFSLISVRRNFKIMRHFLFSVLLIIPLLSLGQEKLNSGGTFQLGMRSTLSAFGGDGYVGMGTGGQFRLKLLDRVNTEWFADYIRGDIGGLGRRVDGHIGWSVMFYPFHDYGSRHFTPYLIAGHCFDYTKVSENVLDLSADRLWQSKERWSSAVQAGLGLHYHFHPKADMTLKAQYMSHLGKDIHARVVEQNGERRFSITESNHNSLEGHVLITFSINISLADLW